ncbi:hypothetical protein AAHE18_14G232200 [Arachis hypogaea]
MRIRHGIESTICEDLVQIEAHMAIPWEDFSLQKLIKETFSNLQSHGWDASYMVERAILTPKNHDVQQFNDIVINQFSGDERILASFDEVEGDTNNLYQQEYLNSISTGGLPPHMLKVKKGVPLMLLRNIDPKTGLCNGTRLLWQTILKVGIYLPKHVFSHGQLYVALSRSVSQLTTKILVKEGIVDGKRGQFTKNVVFKEILLPAPQVHPIKIYSIG